MSVTHRTDPRAATLYADGGSMTVRSVITTGQPDRAGDVASGVRFLRRFVPATAS